MKSEPEWAVISVIRMTSPHLFMTSSCGQHKGCISNYASPIFGLCNQWLLVIFIKVRVGSWAPRSTEKWPPPPQRLLITAFSSCVSKGPWLNRSYCLLSGRRKIIIINHPRLIIKFNPKCCLPFYLIPHDEIFWFLCLFGISSFVLLEQKDVCFICYL